MIPRKMAASMKRKSSDITSEVETKPQPIKIRITSKAATPRVNLNLESSSTNDAFDQLVDLSKKLPLSSEECDNVVRLLLEYFHKMETSSVRIKIVMLLGDIGRTPGFNTHPLIDDLMSILSREKSSKVKSQLLSTVCVLGKSLPNQTSLHSHCVDVAAKNLDSLEFLVRSSSLNLIGSLAQSDTVFTSENGSSMSVQELLGEYTLDQDPRVRTTAFQCLLSLHQRGHKLILSLYQKACNALKDDSEDVRRVGLKLIWVLSHSYPEEMIDIPSAGEEQEKIRLVDDGFAHICQKVNDLSMKVRAEAAVLLGSLHSVSPKFLEQTLDKKLMSQLRRKSTAHERQKEHFASGEWSSGQKWADDAPKEDVDPETVNLINQGACGAFVHGLEDEFKEVRSAAVDSLCELASQSPTFAAISLDFLVDMFNDEIEGVRLNAMTSLCRISQHVVLREDQLETLLNVLDDFSKEIREATHETLCHVRMSTKSCLNRALQLLLHNLNKYPQDRLSIWRCLKHLGNSHPNLTHSVVPELLGTHPFFDTPEPDMDDPAYTAVMILIFNSAKNCPTIVSLFPSYVLRHYSYLRDSIPHLVPEVKHITFSTSSITKKSIDSVGDQDPEKFFQCVLQKMQNLSSLERQAADTLMELVVRDLERIGELKPQLAASAEFVRYHVQCQLLLSKVISGEQITLPLSLSSQQTEETTLSAVEQVLSLTYKLQHLFLGCSTQEIANVFQLRLRAWTLKLVVLLKECVTGTANKKSSKASKLCDEYLKKLQTLLRHFSTHGLEKDSFTQALFAEMHKFDPSKPGILSKFLPSLLIHHPLPSLIFENRVCQSTATINEPTGGSNNPQRFTAGLAVAVSLDAVVENVSDIHQIQIQVKFADSHVELFTPRLTDFRQIGPLKHRLMTNIYLSHGMWSDPCQIELKLVLAYDPGDLMKSKNSQQETSGFSMKVLDLCKPVKVYLMPKPPKRV